MASLFTKIINGEIPCYEVFSDAKHIAFLDINPNSKGHTLCVPKKEIDNLFDLETEDYKDLMLFCKKVETGIRKTIPCQRIALTVIGLEVPHAHVHLIPISSMKDAFFQRKVSLSKEEMQHTAQTISLAIHDN